MIENIETMTAKELLIHACHHGVVSVDFGEVQEELNRRIRLRTNNPRTVEQELLRVFVRLAETLDEYCMGGDRTGISLVEIRHLANEAANAGRALLSLPQGAKQ